MAIAFVSGSPLTKEYAGPGKGAEMAFCTKRIVKRMNKRKARGVIWIEGEVERMVDLTLGEARGKLT